MKRHAQILALAAVATLCLFLPANAQTSGTNTASRNGYFFDPDGNRTTADGSQLVHVTNAPQDYVLLEPGVFSTRFAYSADGLTGGWASPVTVTQDSSRAINVQGYSQLALLISPIFTSKTRCAMFALSVRIGTSESTDSSSVYTVLPHSITTSGAADSIGTFEAFAAMADSLAPGYGGPDTSRVGPGEKILIIGPVKNSTNQLCVMINNRDGTPIAGPVVSFKLRLMNTYGEPLNGAGVATGARTLVPVGNGGNPYGGAIANPETSRPISIRADLIGWR